MKDLSILIRSYNESIFEINRLLNSLFLQKDIYKSEIIIYNDNGYTSTINYIEQFIQNYKFNNIKFIKGVKHIGPGLALRELYKNATKEYIIFCDMDDEYIIDDGLYTTIRLLKCYGCDYIQCDPGPCKLHQMTIFKKDKISEYLFLGFNYRNDEYMCYVYNYLNGIYYSLKFYKWYIKNTGVHKMKFTNQQDVYLWNLYSDLLNKRISKETAIGILNDFKYKDNIIYINFIHLLNTELLN